MVHHRPPAVTGPASATDAGQGLTIRRGRRVPEDPEVSVCILVLDDADLAVRCLDALRRHAPEATTEVVVVANGTAPDQQARLIAGDDAVLVTSPVNLGFGAGCNCAARVARGRFLVFLNDDSMVEPGCVDALVRAAEAVPGVGAVGGFDPQFFPAYFEDVDLCLALAAHGFRVRYEPEARVVHLGSQSTTVPYRRFLLARNRQRLIERWSDALEQFEPRPGKESGPDYEASLERAVRRADAPAAARGVTAASAGRTGGHSFGTADATDAADALREEYLAHLERTEAENHRRIREL